MLRRLLHSSVSPTSPFAYLCKAKGNKCDHGSDPANNDPNGETKQIVIDFLRQSAYKASKTEHNQELRDAVKRTAVSWNTSDSASFIEKLVDTSCDYAETAYGHTSFDHQHFIALYSVIILYLDDIGVRHLEAVGQFVHRFTRGDKQLSPALDALVDLLRQAHDLFTRVGADAIIAGTMDAVTVMYIECTTQNLEIKPEAALYPYYLRTRSGTCPPYIHFIFMKSWRETPNSYLQALPYMERWFVGINDLLSFYKEEKAGETNNYMHMRACTEKTSAANVLRELSNELLTWSNTVLSLFAGDDQLIVIWERYMQKSLEFYVNTNRYRLSELELEY